MSSPWSESSCPIFMAAPRKRASLAASRRALEATSNDAAKVAGFVARESAQPLRSRAYGELSRREAYLRHSAEARLRNRGG